MDQYSKKTLEQVEVNERHISDYRSRIDSHGSTEKEWYEKKLADLRRKNAELKVKMDRFKAGSRTNWVSFKSDVNREMEEIGEAIRHVIAKIDNQAKK